MPKNRQITHTHIKQTPASK